MNGNPSSAESFNSFVRGGVTLLLTIGFLYLALRPKDGLDPSLFANIYSVILGFWFGSRVSQALNTVSVPPASAVTISPAAQSVESKS